MNILYLPLHYYPYRGIGGAAIVSYEIIKRLSKKNKVLVILPGMYRTKLLLQVAEVFPIFQLAHIGDIKLFRPDVILAQYHPSDLISYAGMLLSGLEKCPLIVRSDDVYFTPFKRFAYVSYFIHRLNYKLISKSDLFLVNSSEHKLMVKSIYGRQDGVLVHPNGVDINRFNPRIDGEEIRQKLGLEDKDVILYAGSLAWFYGLHLLPRAFKAVMKERKDSTLLLIGMFGSDDAKKTFLHELEKYCIRQRTLMLPPVPYEYIHKYIALADVCIGTLSSFLVNIGTIPTKILQYMACGKPTVVSEGGVSKDLIINEKTGLTFSGNHKDLADRIIMLLQDKGLSQRIGREARSHVETNYNWDQLVSRLESLMLHAISARSYYGRRS
jgi:glycosyltransferase involved in cell wall biosynthesis